MSNNELPNLSAWHRVPVGAVIPKGTPYAYAYEDGVNVELRGCFEDFTVRDSDTYFTYYTEHPVTPPLPTEEGATIVASVRSDRKPCVLMERTADRRWFCPEHGFHWRDDEIRAWAPVTIGEVAVIR